MLIFIYKIDAGFCPDCKMRHDPPCNGTLWKEWLIETGPEEEAGHVVQQVEGDGMLHLMAGLFRCPD